MPSLRPRTPQKPPSRTPSTVHARNHRNVWRTDHRIQPKGELSRSPIRK